MPVESSARTRSICPSCGTRGRRVGPATLRALLNEEHAREFRVGEPASCDTNSSDHPGCTPSEGDTGWRFCDSPECDVVYYSEIGDRTFLKAHLRVPVGVKEKVGDRPLCYCFGHSVASIKEELRTKGRSDALQDIRAKMKDPGCRCETENPSGACCLGSVTQGIMIALEELNSSDRDIGPAVTSVSARTNRRELIARIGAVVSAIMASACCWLPLVLLAVGVSGAGIAATLEMYRPLFIVVTFGFLGAAFYLSYRPRKAAVAGRDGCCAPEAVEAEACCAATDNRLFNMMGMNKVMLWVVTVLAVAALYFPSYVGLLFGTGSDSAVRETMNRAVFRIEGMTCEGCATTVAEAIRQVPGVLAVEVSYENKQAVVGAEACCPVPREAILTAIEELGYQGSLKSARPASSLSVEGK